MEDVNTEYQAHFYGGEKWVDSKATDYLSPDFGCFHDDYLAEGILFSKYQRKEEQEDKISDYELLNDTRLDVDSPPLETCLEEIAKLSEIPPVISDVEPKKEKECPISLAALELLKNYSGGVKKMERERVMEASNGIKSNERKKLSTDEILRIAGTRFIQSSSQPVDHVPSMLRHPFECSFYGFSYEETKDVELVELLLACAEKVGSEQFERGSKLLSHCYKLCSNTGNPVQRLVYYCCEALRERIDNETGRSIVLSLSRGEQFDINKAMMSLNGPHHAFHQEIPFSQLSIFAGLQAIIENVAEAKKIHIIDLGIRIGLQWTILMQALASSHECQLELLKITAIGTIEKHLIEETGERLLSFAKTMNIPLSFKVVMVSDMSHLREDLFELDADEKVAVYSSFSLSNFLSEPTQLESLMRVIRGLNPCVMVVTEVEANHNSPVFVNRFIEALFFYGILIDSLESIMNRNESNRMVFEEYYCFQRIIDIVANEGEKRKARNVKIDIWRAFFARFGMEELKLSTSSLYQASLILKNCQYRTACSIEILNGKCLMIGWKGTPLQSLSVWKFL